jgi:F420-dependent oxidoreductase-like protein
MARIAAMNPAVRTLEESVNRAREAERMGFESVWTTQMPDARDASLVLAAYAAVTQWVRLGTGVLPIYTCHPTAMAQMAATLDEVSNGRFILGLGVGHKVTVESMWGLKLEHPVEAMREYVGIVRASLRDGSAHMDGKQFSAHWSYSGPRRADLPIMISALSPLMLELAGEISDGVVLWMCSPEYIRQTVIPRVSAGRAKAGKTMEGFEVVAAVPACVTNDRAAGLSVFRQTVERYAGLPFYRKVLDAGGFKEELDAGNISEQLLDTFGGVGDESRVRDAVRRYRAAGVTLPCIGPFSGHPGAAGYVATLEAASSA